ncbi:unnamed protein product [Oncorhynchus mykiss]|uniref:Uncharacterized protein n=1 Tax=Oncorhynchus mykiss TaxID=8022 RepID=A0A060YLC5_ONCMY|nr:unnamed protein product [Oncorhynchus mykiss]
MHARTHTHTQTYSTLSHRQTNLQDVPATDHRLGPLHAVGTGVHEKHDQEGLITTLCDQVGHRDFDVEKRLGRDLKRTHALLVDAQLLPSTIDNPGHNQAPGSKEHIERLHCQLGKSEARSAGVFSEDSVHGTGECSELENICKHKHLVDEQVVQLQHEKSDLLKRLEENQEDLDELLNKHKALIAQSSGGISQVRELQAELEEVNKQRHTVQEELATSVTRVQLLESPTVGRSVVSKQEAKVCDLQNKLEFQRGQVKRFEVLHLRESVVCLGEELEQSAETGARERENRQRLHEMEDLAQREQDSSRRRIELEMPMTELSTVRQTLRHPSAVSLIRRPPWRKWSLVMSDLYLTVLDGVRVVSGEGLKQWCVWEE